MQRLVNLSRRALISGTTIAVVGILSHALFSGQALAADPVPANCSTLALANPVYVTGSSAVGSVITALSPKLAAAATPITIVYTSLGSCDGANSIIQGTALTSVGTYYTAGGDKATCQLTTEKADIGLADVYPTSCPDVTPASLSGITDFGGPIQAMNFVVPSAAKQTVISAEAAYLTFGLGTEGGTDWNNPALFAIRNFQSGTETMLATAINVPTSKFLGMDKGSGGGVVTAIATPAGAVDQTIGILSSNDADKSRATIKRLAYQHYGQECAYYPDSTFTSTDKKNVREGHYAVWGPLHMLAKTSPAGEPTSVHAKSLLDVLLGTTAVADVDVVKLEAQAYTVPQCAMHVKRTSEMGPISSYSPTGACSCYYDQIMSGTEDVPAGCTACTEANAATKCTGATPKCNYGFCEAK